VQAIYIKKALQLIKFGAKRKLLREIETQGNIKLSKM